MAPADLQMGLPHFNAWVDDLDTHVEMSVRIVVETKWVMMAFWQLEHGSPSQRWHLQHGAAHEWRQRPERWQSTRRLAPSLPTGSQWWSEAVAAHAAQGVELPGGHLPPAVAVPWQ